MTTQEMLSWIDNATYEELLRKWRFAPAGDPFFAGKVGEHYSQVMARKQLQVGHAEHVRASQRIGWRGADALSPSPCGRGARGEGAVLPSPHCLLPIADCPPLRGEAP